MIPHEHTHREGESRPATPAYLRCGRSTTVNQVESCAHLHVFDYVTGPHGNGVVIHLLPQRVGIILDTTGEEEYLEHPGDIEQIQPIAFVSGSASLQEQCEVTSEEDEYRYLDPYAWPYNDPEMTDDYLTACGFPTRETAGYPFQTKPEHVERLRGTRLVSTPLGKGKLWRNWDTQVGVILEGTQRVTFFSKSEEWSQIVPMDMVSLSDEERQIKKAMHQE